MNVSIHLSPTPSGPTLCYYRATAKARLPGIVDAMHDRSPYLHDILLLCLRGAWDLELRQFMPPVSLRASVSSLLELGLIESVDNPPAPPALERLRDVRRSLSQLQPA